MDKNYTIEVSNGIFTVRFANIPDIEDIKEALSQGRLVNLRIWVFGEVDLSRVEIECLGNFVQSLKLPTGKTAIVAPCDLTYGLARMYEMHRKFKGIQYAVFRSEQEALKWLKDRH